MTNGCTWVHLQLHGRGLNPLQHFVFKRLLKSGRALNVATLCQAGDRWCASCHFERLLCFDHGRNTCSHDSCQWSVSHEACVEEQRQSRDMYRPWSAKHMHVVSRVSKCTHSQVANLIVILVNPWRTATKRPSWQCI